MAPLWIWYVNFALEGRQHITQYFGMAGNNLQQDLRRAGRLPSPLPPLLQCARGNLQGSRKLGLRQAAFQLGLDDVVGIDLVPCTVIASLHISNGL